MTPEQAEAHLQTPATGLRNQLHTAIQQLKAVLGQLKMARQLADLILHTDGTPDAETFSKMVELAGALAQEIGAPQDDESTPVAAEVEFSENVSS
jgi:hypothetical protein